MMNYKGLFSMLALVATMALTACDDPNSKLVPVAPTLTVAQSEALQLPASKATAEVAVTTNQATWSVMVDDEWLAAVPHGNKLSLQATDNSGVALRRTQVHILSGNLTHTFTVEQAGTQPTLVLGFAPDPLDQWGGDLRMDVACNADTWEASTKADWLTLTPDTAEGVLHIKVAENTSRDSRTATIVVRETTGGDEKSFVVSQSGIVYFILPYLNAPMSPADFIAFEEARRSTKTVDHSYSQPYYEFKTVSPLFPKIRYYCEKFNKESLEKVVLYVADKAMLQGDALKELVDYYKASGFEAFSDRVFFSDATGAEAAVQAAATEPGVSFTFYGKQVDHYGMLTRLPMRDFKLRKTTMAEVEAFQKEVGGVLSPKYSLSSLRKTYHAEEKTSDTRTDIVTYYYEFSIGTLSKHIFVDPRLAWYIYFPEGVDQFYLTAEFRRLLAQEGYDFHSRTQSSIDGSVFAYRNAEKKIELRVKFVKNPYPADGDKGNPQAHMEFRTYY